MGFSKIKMGEEEIFTTIVQEQDGREIAKWKVMKRDWVKVVRTLSKQFGLKIKILDKFEDRDLDWAMR